ncbi:MAG: 2-oxoglutarate dehydrogenase E1 component [Planctomycetota bacterium]|nr:2-oxoglutarate dehydrogenase E1 component [Planctomycetota bacterium]
MARGEAESQSRAPHEDRSDPGAESGRSVNAFNPEYVEALYIQWKSDQSSVSEDWNRFFLGFELGLETSAGSGTIEPAGTGAEAANSKQGRVDALIYQYRDIGHLAAQLDPLGGHRPFPDELTLEALTLSDANLDDSFDPGTLPLPNPSSLREIIELLEETYCRGIGVEYMHIQNRERRRWLQKRMEPTRNHARFGSDRKLHLLQKLIEADGFESFLKKRYVGKKRFGLEGGESLIPLLDQLVEVGAENGISEIAIGMAHRGRLNVLANILDKTFNQIFTEFHETWTEDYLDGGGDVKYHQGYSNDCTTSSGREIRLTLAPNPSHLEFVTSVVLGRCRAKQRLKGDEDREQVIPLIIHGDAAFPGQGVVAECFNMMNLDGFTVGGTVHVVLNNQVGFTTDPSDAFSGHYCTDVAKMVDAPIFHVNGDDPEACAWVAQLALEYRQTFKNDVVIDMWCYRRNGHNEADEPSFTQPLMYKKIKEMTPVTTIYRDRLVGEGVLEASEYQARCEALEQSLDEAQAAARATPVDPTINPFADVWSGIDSMFGFEPVDTSIDMPMVEKITAALTRTPDDFKLHRTVHKQLGIRGTPAESPEAEVDWATAELLAYGSLLVDGHAVRLTGQDIERGTFSHRHSVLYDQRTGESWTPLNEIEDGQAKICLHNSPLTECAVVGFEYGYSLADPRMLIIWEAQFGDFANGAQVIFDQFLASAEVKWQRYSGLTLFLPHGYEGQGPEHSSARMERFLTLCADENMQVCYPSSASQIFHLLRRQMKQTFRKPLIVMTPKSMLRLPAARCLTRDLTDGRFQTIIDPMTCEPEDVTQVIFCTGKVYYELENRREELARKDLEIVRIEQLYPLDRTALQEVLDRYPNAKRFLWTQEEPENNGAWRFIESRFRRMFGLDLEYVGRDENASPAVGSLSISNLEHIAILDQAIGSLESGHEDQATSDPVAPDPVDEVTEATPDPGESEPVAARKPTRSRGKNSTKSRRKNKAS